MSFKKYDNRGLFIEHARLPSNKKAFFISNHFCGVLPLNPSFSPQEESSMTVIAVTFAREEFFGLRLEKSSGVF
jgi:hypothetical protein